MGIQLTTPVPGPKSRALRLREDAHLSPGLQGFALMAGIAVDRARGSYITDVDGNTFLDLIGGIGVNGLGHSHPKWVRAMQAQIEKASVGSFTSQPRVELFEKIAKRPPAPGLTRTQLYSGGTEAVESALRLAKNYTKKTEFISFQGGFHGKTMGTLSLMGSDFKKTYGPFMPDCYTVPYPNLYRKPFDVPDAQLTHAVIENLRNFIRTKTRQEIAAILVEPMQGTAGNSVPPADFLPELRKVADEFQALLILDEMITGFGRTGRYWGAEHSGVQADIVTVGKQFGGGYPMSALISRTEIVNTRPWGDPSGSSSSYGGNPLAAASALAALSIIEEEGLVENSKRQGEHFLKLLKPFQEKFSFVGEVRGEGLFLAIEMVKDKQTREPLSKKACESVFRECLKNGLLTMSYAPSFRLQPAMTIDQDSIREAAHGLEKAFQSIENSGAWRD